MRKRFIEGRSFGRWIELVGQGEGEREREREREREGELWDLYVYFSRILEMC